MALLPCSSPGLALWLPATLTAVIPQARLACLIEAGPRSYASGSWIGTALPIPAAEGFHLPAGAHRFATAEPQKFRPPTRSRLLIRRFRRWRSSASSALIAANHVRIAVPPIMRPATTRACNDFLAKVIPLHILAIARGRCCPSLSGAPSSRSCSVGFGDGHHLFHQWRRPRRIAPPIWPDWSASSSTFWGGTQRACALVLSIASASMSPLVVAVDPNTADHSGAASRSHPKPADCPKTSLYLRWWPAQASASLFSWASATRFLSMILSENRFFHFSGIMLRACARQPRVHAGVEWRPLAELAIDRNSWNGARLCCACACAQLVLANLHSRIAAQALRLASDVGVTLSDRASDTAPPRPVFPART